MQSQSQKLTIKLKIDKSASNPLPTADRTCNIERELNASSNFNPPNNPLANSKDEVDLHSTEDNGKKENSQYQLVVYDPKVNNSNGTLETRASEDSICRRTLRPHPFANQTTRVMPSVGAFTVQCSNCFKWRVVPTKEKYEEIREHITEQPFVCETGREWRPMISCDDPPDITQDGSRLWAIDKPNIAQTPPGWQRLLRIRGEGGSKFADVYYVSPLGKRLRSMVEVQRYLNEHPEYTEDGVNLSRFSFQTPKPLCQNYVRKRSAQDALSGDTCATGILKVKPLAWVRHDVDTDLQLSGPGQSIDYSKSRGPTPESKSAKKGLKRTLSKRSCDTDLGKFYNLSDVDVGDSCQL